VSVLQSGAVAALVVLEMAFVRQLQGSAGFAVGALVAASSLLRALLLCWQRHGSSAPPKES